MDCDGVIYGGDVTAAYADEQPAPEAGKAGPAQAPPMPDMGVSYWES